MPAASAPYTGITLSDAGGQGERTRTRLIARRLDLQNELPERVPNRALCAFVKPVAVCCGAPGR